jgi:hypothetical protein
MATNIKCFMMDVGEVLLGASRLMLKRPAAGRRDSAGNPQLRHWLRSGSGMRGSDWSWGRWRCQPASRCSRLQWGSQASLAALGIAIVRLTSTPKQCSRNRETTTARWLLLQGFAKPTEAIDIHGFEDRISPARTGAR